jgi:hypothetical protein
MPLADKIAKATYIIDNSTDIETTRKQVKDIHNKLKQSNCEFDSRSEEVYSIQHCDKVCQ